MIIERDYPLYLLYLQYHLTVPNKCNLLSRIIYHISKVMREGKGFAKQRWLLKGIIPFISLPRYYLTDPNILSRPNKCNLLSRILYKIFSIKHFSKAPQVLRQCTLLSENCFVLGYLINIFWKFWQYVDVKWSVKGGSYMHWWNIMKCLFISIWLKKS